MQFDAVWKAFPILIDGIRLTLVLTVASLAVGTALGLGLALLRTSRVAIASRSAAVVVTFFLATPVLVQLFWIYYVLPQQFNILLDLPQTLIVTLGLNGAAIMAENFRSGLQAVGIGQREAASVLGLSRAQAFRHVVFPQAFRIIVPLMGSTTISLLKDTSLATFIGGDDLLNNARHVAIITYRPIEVFSVVAVLYFVLTYPLAIGTSLLERRWRVRK